MWAAAAPIQDHIDDGKALRVKALQATRQMLDAVLEQDSRLVPLLDADLKTAVEGVVDGLATGRTKTWLDAILNMTNPEVRTPSVGFSPAIIAGLHGLQAQIDIELDHWGAGTAYRDESRDEELDRRNTGMNDQRHEDEERLQRARDQRADRTVDDRRGLDGGKQRYELGRGRREGDDPRSGAIDGGAGTARQPLGTEHLGERSGDGTSTRPDDSGATYAGEAGTKTPGLETRAQDEVDNQTRQPDGPDPGSGIPHGTEMVDN